MNSYQLKSHEALMLNNALTQSKVITEFLLTLAKELGMNPEKVRLTSSYTLVDLSSEVAPIQDEPSKPE